VEVNVQVRNQSNKVGSKVMLCVRCIKTETGRKGTPSVTKICVKDFKALIYPFSEFSSTFKYTLPGAQDIETASLKTSVSHELITKVFLSDSKKSKTVVAVPLPITIRG